MENKIKLAKGLGFLKYCKCPMNKFVCSFGNGVLSVLPKGMRSSRKLKIKRGYIKSFDGEDILLYVIAPKTEIKQKRPCIVYLHGGGFVYKGVFVQYRNLKKYAEKANMVAVYVDYRLAEKHPYPTPLEDCYHAYKWVLENAKQLNIDPRKIVIGGDSAGGCLAVGVTMLAYDEKLRKPAAQFLVYPVLDKRMKTESMQKYNNTPMWNGELNKKMWDVYLGGYSKEMLKYASPAEIDNFKIFPKTFIETAEFDCLHDEGVDFAEKLRFAKVDVVLNETLGTVHGYDLMKHSKVFKDAMKQRIDFLKSID